MKERSKERKEEREKKSELLRTAYKITLASETVSNSKEVVHYGQVVRGAGVHSLHHCPLRTSRIQDLEIYSEINLYSANYS